MEINNSLIGKKGIDIDAGLRIGKLSMVQLDKISANAEKKNNSVVNMADFEINQMDSALEKLLDKLNLPFHLYQD